MDTTPCKQKAPLNPVIQTTVSGNGNIIGGGAILSKYKARR